MITAKIPATKPIRALKNIKNWRCERFLDFQFRNLCNKDLPNFATFRELAYEYKKSRNKRDVIFIISIEDVIRLIAHYQDLRVHRS